MDSLSAACTSFPSPSTWSSFTSLKFRHLRCWTSQFHGRRAPTVIAALKTDSHEIMIREEDVLLSFLKERELNGDFVAKVSDKLWLSEAMKIVNSEGRTLATDASQLRQEPLDDDTEIGFLKLTRTKEWLLGDNLVPVDKKLSSKGLQNDGERRKRLNLLKYEALKRDLLVLTIGIGTLCSGYCLVALSVQAALSYATGVFFSCLYLLLLYQHSDNLSKETVPQIFLQKKSKKIGIRSQDLEDLFERLVKGSNIALSSPRLVIPTVIYGLWALSQNFANDFVDFQLVPAVVGLFAYKAAALVQVYRDNEDLQIVFPENPEDSSD